MLKNSGNALAAAGLLLGLAGLGGCSADDVVGVNDCGIITIVSNVKDTYVVGETSNVTVTYQARNPSASCANSIMKKVMKFGSSASSVASFMPTGQLIALTPGTATLTWGPDTAQPFSKTITVVAPPNPNAR